MVVFAFFPNRDLFIPRMVGRKKPSSVYNHRKSMKLACRVLELVKEPEWLWHEGCLSQHLMRRAYALDSPDLPTVIVSDVK